jgi:hypothetical protein
LPAAQLLQPPGDPRGGPSGQTRAAPCCASATPPPRHARAHARSARPCKNCGSQAASPPCESQNGTGSRAIGVKLGNI